LVEDEAGRGAERVADPLEVADAIIVYNSIYPDGYRDVCGRGMIIVITSYKF
jgi:hypothetical protein